MAQEVSSEALRQAVTVEGIHRHLAVLQLVADANGGNRAAGTSGYDLSALYVYNQLALAGYQVTLQRFEFPFYQEMSPPALAQVTPQATHYRPNMDFSTLDHSGGGEVTAPLQAVDLAPPPDPATATHTSGCEASDFAGFTPGNIALLQRGVCPFAQKVSNAAAAGAAAVVVFNDGEPGHRGLIRGTLGASPTTLPVIGATFALGRELAERLEEGPVTLYLKAETAAGMRTTVNVLAETPGGRADRIVMIGAHLDSTAAGPGINDNGSGSATILEIARQMAALDIRPENKVRFAFWGAEELGLLGSDHYVSQLRPEERQSIAAYLNFDMVGSSNFVRFVYEGGGSSNRRAATDEEAPPLTAQAIEQLFLDYFAAQGLATEPLAMGGGSDSASFVAAGIPAGGLFSGVDTPKTGEEAALYGGTAGEPYDPCYHQECDNLANISPSALDQFSDAAAHVLLTLATADSVDDSD
jgi:Zn-dependent M28 family amino/carboxypeptidase